LREVLKGASSSRRPFFVAASCENGRPMVHCNPLRSHYMSNSPSFAIPTWNLPSLAIRGEAARFPVRRIFCVGRNYAEHQT
jgi:2-keto-4-pentenoate hydratase/2-oxohepta-3-ene-1,7-dioic acid hydratase in catechol pathway